jgi:hypothetical protein
MSGELSRRLLAGDELLRRLSRIVAAGRGAEDAEHAPERATPHSPQAIVAAANAFSERKRAPGIAA